MNIKRWLKLRQVRRSRVLRAELRTWNRSLNEALARKTEVRGETEIITLGLQALAARNMIGRLSRRLGLTWEQARMYA